MREETGNGLHHRVDNGQRSSASLAEVSIRLPDDSDRIDRAWVLHAFFLLLHVWRLMDGSHLILIVVGTLTALSVVTSLGAMFALGRGKAYDK